MVFYPPNWSCPLKQCFLPFHEYVFISLVSTNTSFNIDVISLLRRRSHLLPTILSLHSSVWGELSRRKETTHSRAKRRHRALTFPPSWFHPHLLFLVPSVRGEPSQRKETAGSHRKRSPHHISPPQLNPFKLPPPPPFFGSVGGEPSPGKEACLSCLSTAHTSRSPSRQQRKVIPPPGKVHEIRNQFWIRRGISHFNFQW